jgi:alanyl-tRNA synthetase
MQPLLPYLLGEKHEYGTKLVDSQRCFRANDIEEVGDNRHDTFFEMLGNWSLGEYFKQEQIPYFFEFLTKIAGINPNRLYFTVFSGEEKYDLPKDEESITIWQKLLKEAGVDTKVVELGSTENAEKLGMQDGRIFYYNSKKNWWSRAGSPEEMPDGEPGGPDTEVFYLFENVEHDPKYGENCHPNCDCGRFVEIGNSVFMQYIKKDGKFKELPNKNVDFGGGLERILMAANNEQDMFKNDLHWPIIEYICKELNIGYEDDTKTTFNLRVISDHIKAAVFLIKDGVTPSNKLQGYILRRLLRRSLVKLQPLTTNTNLLTDLVPVVMDIYNDTDYFENTNPEDLQTVIAGETTKFQKTLEKGLREIEKIEQIDGKIAFDLFQSYGFPFEITQEIFTEKGQEVSKEEFDEEFKKHQQSSRS